MRISHALVVVTLLTGCAHTEPSPAAVESPAAATPAPAPVAAAPAADLRKAELKAQEAYQLLSDGGDPAKALSLYEEAWEAGGKFPVIAYNAACAAALAGQKETAISWLTRAVEGGWSDADALQSDPDLASIAKEPEVVALGESMRKRVTERLAKANPGSGLPRSTPEAEGIDPAALAQLLKAAEASGTSGLVLVRNGKLVGEWYFDQARGPIEAMSATKSVVSLAVGLLLQDGKLKSIDEPVATFFPEWREGTKGKVTIRHLLSHTSGLKADRTTERIYASPDFVRHALESEVGTPGETYFYNNSAVNLLAGVVGAAAGKRLDEYLHERLFKPMGITDVTWTLDDAGNPHGMSGMQIHPADFAKIGQLMLDGGAWKGQRIIDARWVAESTQRPSQRFNPTVGYLWWLSAPNSTYSFDQAFFEEMEKKKVDPALLEKLGPVRGKQLSRPELITRLSELLGEEGVTEFQIALAKAGVMLRQQVAGDYDGFAALGYLGQTLAVFPKERLVAVRMARPTREVPPEVLEFPAFGKLVRELVARPSSAKSAAP